VIDNAIQKAESAGFFALRHGHANATSRCAHYPPHLSSALESRACLRYRQPGCST